MLNYSLINYLKQDLERCNDCHIDCQLGKSISRLNAPEKNIFTLHKLQLFKEYNKLLKYTNFTDETKTEKVINFLEKYELI